MSDQPFTILSVYNRYLNRGGEDEVFEAEADLLQRNGCRVVRVTEEGVTPVGFTGKTVFAANSIWSRRWKKKMADALTAHRPNVVHVHNWFPSISPSIYYACQAAGVPVVQTLHNYRLLCPAAYFFRDGHVCEDCLSQSFPWPGVLHGCYHDSRLQTAGVATILGVHRILRTWQKQVDLFICLTEFARRKFIDGGLPAARTTVKPNFIHPDPGLGGGQGGYALFAGRLSAEKGVPILLEAWRKLGSKLPLKIAGDGPLAGQVRDASRSLPQLEYLGRQPRRAIWELMKEAHCLIFPSQWYEGFALAVIEALAAGLPVVTSQVGSMELMIRDYETGLHFRAGDVADLVTQVEWLLAHPAERQAMRLAARREYEECYTAQQNFKLLMKVYQQVTTNAPPQS